MLPSTNTAQDENLPKRTTTIGSNRRMNRANQRLPEQTWPSTPQNKTKEHTVFGPFGLVLTYLSIASSHVPPFFVSTLLSWQSCGLPGANQELPTGKLSELPNKYQKDALPTVFYGFRFWIPVSVLNFWYICLVCLSPLLLEQLQC
ncbi:Mpv17/PMP22 [Corchorus olitorius]|uniref:Mpv17/PMP22 n=1 Tax=Corchorus olitorius TaxID=93759 RepID=A0A1R3JJ05_9ROSI|nr:Mpv17/PMP22 [Corchorus olitorius]